MKKKLRNHQVAMCLMLLLSGLALLGASFVVPPTGVIDPSVLTAFGEILTFTGAVTGIDAKYKHIDNDDSCGQ